MTWVLEPLVKISLSAPCWSVFYYYFIFFTPVVLETVFVHWLQTFGPNNHDARWEEGTEGINMARIKIKNKKKSVILLKSAEKETPNSTLTPLTST